MERDEIVNLIYRIIKCNGRTLDCIGIDCRLCMAERLADYIEVK